MNLILVFVKKIHETGFYDFLFKKHRIGSAESDAILLKMEDY